MFQIHIFNTFNASQVFFFLLGDEMPNTIPIQKWKGQKKFQYQGRRTECIYQKEYFIVLSETAYCWSSPIFPKVLKNHNCVIQLLENFKVNFQIMKFSFLRNLVSQYVSMFEIANRNLLLPCTLLIQHYKCMWYLQTNKTVKELTT